MGELQHRAGAEHVARAQPVGQPRRRGGVLARQRGGQPRRRRAAEDRQRPGELVRAVAELDHPAQHRPGDRLGAEAVHPRQQVSVTRRAQRGSQRLQQERVPAGAGVTSLAQLVIGLRAQPLAHQRRGSLCRQRP